METNVEITRHRFSPTATERPTMGLFNPKSFLAQKYENRYDFGTMELLRTGYFLLQGWKYDFRKHLKRYLVKQYGQWTEYYAPNRTLLRKAVYGRIEEIVELKNAA
jgi:hypothetical protein